VLEWLHWQAMNVRRAISKTYIPNEWNHFYCNLKFLPLKNSYNGSVLTQSDKLYANTYAQTSLQ
jgi:hypothetical protein